VRRIGCLLAVAAWLAPPVARADDAVPVSTRRCGWLDDAELVRLTRLELMTAASDMRGLSVDYSCGGNDVTIAIANDESKIRVERLVTGACCADVEPERTVALLAIGLLRAARALLSFAPSNTLPDGGTAPPAAVVFPAVTAGGEAIAGETALASPDAATANPTLAMPNVLPATAPMAPGFDSAPRAPVWQTAPDTAEEVDDHVHQLGLSARARFHNVEDIISVYGVGAHYRAWPWTDVSLGAMFEASFGSAGRAGGSVDLTLLSLGAALGWRFANWSAAALRAELRGGGTWVSLSGVADSANYQGEAVNGATGNACFALVPSLRSGRAELELPIEVGGLFRAPRGLVDGDDGVQVDGFFVGGGIALSFGWYPRPPDRGVAGR
jgi:hypothetical protein